MSKSTLPPMMPVHPAEGLLIRDPQTRRHLPPEGAEVPAHDLYWQRRLADKDVLPGLKPAKKAKSEP